MKEKARNLKPSRDGYMGGFAGMEGKGEMFNSNAASETNKQNLQKKKKRYSDKLRSWLQTAIP